MDMEALTTKLNVTSWDLYKTSRGDIIDFSHALGNIIYIDAKTKNKPR